MRHLFFVIVSLWISSAAASAREWLFPGEYESHQARPAARRWASFPPDEVR
jgi:hypothetical protein